MLDWGAGGEGDGGGAVEVGAEEGARGHGVVAAGRVAAEERGGGDGLRAIGVHAPDLHLTVQLERSVRQDVLLHGVEVVCGHARADVARIERGRTTVGERDQKVRGPRIRCARRVHGADFLVRAQDGVVPVKEHTARARPLVWGERGGVCGRRAVAEVPHAQAVPGIAHERVRGRHVPPVAL